MYGYKLISIKFLSRIRPRILMSSKSELWEIPWQILVNTYTEKPGGLDAHFEHVELPTSTAI